MPRILFDKAVPDFRILPMRLDISVPSIRLVDCDDIGRIGRGQRSIAFDDHQIVVVRAGSLETEVVRSRHDHGILAERIEHDDLAVNVNA